MCFRDLTLKYRPQIPKVKGHDLKPSLSLFLCPPAAYSHVVENTAFFGDVALRFPRIVHHYYDRNSDWGGLLRWGLNFCNQTGVFTGGAHQHVLTLVRSDDEPVVNSAALLWFSVQLHRLDTTV